MRKKGKSEVSNLSEDLSLLAADIAGIGSCGVFLSPADFKLISNETGIKVDLGSSEDMSANLFKEAAASQELAKLLAAISRAISKKVAYQEEFFDGFDAAEEICKALSLKAGEIMDRLKDAALSSAQAQLG